LNEYALSLVIM